MQYNSLQEGTRMPRLKGSADLLEDRRRRALALWDTGLSLNEVGRRIQCAPSSVLRWLRARRRGGPDALRVRFSPGRPLKLGASQRRRLVKVLLKGPQAHGYRTQLWTTARIAEVIGREFGVHYHRDHVGRLMHSLKWSPQKPETRAVERDEEAIERWKRKDWPRERCWLAGSSKTLPPHANLALARFTKNNSSKRGGGFPVGPSNFLVNGL